MRCIWAMLALLIAVPAMAQTPPATPAPTAAIIPLPELKSRAGQLLAVLNGGGDTAALFSPEVLAHLPDAQIRAIAKQLGDGFGRALAIDAIEPVHPTAAHIRIRYERGLVSMDLAIEEAPPRRLIGLRITGTAAPEATLDAAAAALKALPGATGFAFAKLGDTTLSTILAIAPDRSLAVGSAFKLAILAELIRATNKGERRWSDMVTLDGGPLPAGFYTQQPAGTQVTLRALAERMISASDNSAADILLAWLGREKVEAMLPVLGWRDAARNRPMMATLDLFKLKAVAGGALGKRWLQLDEAGKRALLKGEIAATPLSAIDPRAFRDGTVRQIDTIEWFASAADLVRTMDWIRRNTESGAGAEARAILASNPGVGPANAAAWRYIGYKGGSEPGVINMTFLLQAQDGGWYALVGSWNDPATPVDNARFIALISRAVALAAMR